MISAEIKWEQFLNNEPGVVARISMVLWILFCGSCDLCAAQQRGRRTLELID